MIEWFKQALCKHRWELIGERRYFPWAVAAEIYRCKDCLKQKEVSL